MLSKSVVPINTRVDRLLFERIETWRSARRPIQARSDALRELLEAALDSANAPSETKAA